MEQIRGERKKRWTIGWMDVWKRQKKMTCAKERYLFDIMDCKRAIFIHIPNESFKSFNFKRSC